ncbi:MbeD family mobilization/exclusion protein, partial [Shigella flexneri]|nr:MbeD family mobilization/exclusion protein [Shigella flexneri]
LSALESLQTSYAQQQQGWQDSSSSLQRLFETPSQALERNGRVCLTLSNQVNALPEQVERLSSDLFEQSGERLARTGRTLEQRSEPI